MEQYRGHVSLTHDRAAATERCPPRLAIAALKALRFQLVLDVALGGVEVSNTAEEIDAVTAIANADECKITHARSGQIRDGAKAHQAKREEMMHAWNLKAFEHATEEEMRDRQFGRPFHLMGLT